MSIEKDRQQDLPQANLEQSHSRDKRITDSAAVLGGVVWTLATINFAGGYVASKVMDNRDSDGNFIGGKYYPNGAVGSEPVFECNPDKNVVRQETFAVLDEFGEEVKEKYKQNYGNPDACGDGELTPEDGKVWNSKLNEWGLAGMVFNPKSF